MTMKSAKVSELKARLSAYLREVRRGEVVEIYDRNTPVARLIPAPGPSVPLSIREPTAGPEALRSLERVALAPGTDIARVLAELREDRS